MKYIFAVIIGAITGNLIYFISKYIVQQEEDRRFEYKLSRVSVIVAIVIFTIATTFKFNLLEELIKFWSLGVLLILIGIIDYYTVYVYLKLAAIGSVVVLVITIGAIECSGNWMQLYIKEAAIVGISLFISAFFTSKWYGDVFEIMLITLIIGYLGILPVVAVASTLYIGIRIYKVAKHRKAQKKELVCIELEDSYTPKGMPLCPLLAIGYFVFLVIC